MSLTSPAGRYVRDTQSDDEPSRNSVDIQVRAILHYNINIKGFFIYSYSKGGAVGTQKWTRPYKETPWGILSWMALSILKALL